MSDRIKALRERQAKLIHDAREKFDLITEDTDESRADELEREYDKMMDQHDRLERQVEREEKLDAAEERSNAPDPRRPAPSDVVVTIDPTDSGPTYEETFDKYLRWGAGDLTREERAQLRQRKDQGEQRAQGTSPDTAGGYTVPTGFSNELVKSLKMYGPMLDPGVTREISTSTGNDVEWPTMDDTSNKGALLAENAADSEQDVVFGQKILNAFKYTSRIIRVSEELAQDSAFDLEALLRETMAERIGRIVNEHLTTGTGSGQPDGIVTASTAGLTAAAAAAISFDDLIDLAHSVDPAYRADPTVRWMFHDQTLKVLRKIKDGESNYIWQPANVATGAPAQILEYPYVINQDMPQLSVGESPAVQEKPVVFGAFNRYIVRRVREFVFKRLVERYAENQQIGFIGFARFDGELMDTGAVKHMLMPAA